MSKEKDMLSFDLDRSQEPDAVLEMYETSYPGSRHKFIELIEDSSDRIRFDGKIDCRHLQWEFQCPKDWSDLKATAMDDVRFCESCNQKVYTAYSRKDLKRLQSEGACIRIITKVGEGLLGAIMGPEYASNENSMGEELVYSIVEMMAIIDAFYKRRSYYDEHSLMRVENMLSRFDQQISEGIRDPNTGLKVGLSAFDISPQLHESVRKVFELKADNEWLDIRRAHNHEYESMKPLTLD